MLKQMQSQRSFKWYLVACLWTVLWIAGMAVVFYKWPQLATWVRVVAICVLVITNPGIDALIPQSRRNPDSTP